jgi:modification methylase
MENLFTKHTIRLGDTRDLSFIDSETIHLVCTSPPYFNLIHYPEVPAQLGNIGSYDTFLEELDKVWAECFRILVPGGRIACVVGDVCVSRRNGGRHHVLPLAADIQVRARHIGFDNLNPIRWSKITNIRLEASRSCRFLGKPNLPNGIVKNDIETILFLRKPGYRKPSKWQQENSFISTDDYSKWFRSVWTDIPGQSRTHHPSPFPLKIPRRLIRMFSFIGDTVLDPFGGSGTTAIAALETGRNSISVDIEPGYIELMEQRLRDKGISSNQLNVDCPNHFPDYKRKGLLRESSS